MFGSNIPISNYKDIVEALPDGEKHFLMAQIKEDDQENYNLKRSDSEDHFFMERFAFKVDNAGYMVFPGHTLVCKERVCLGGLLLLIQSQSSFFCLKADVKRKILR